MHRTIAAVLFALALGVDVQAQTVHVLTPADRISFIASPDHDVAVFGLPLLSKYQFVFVPDEPNAPAVPPFDLGKPTPAADGEILVPTSSFAQFGTLPANVRYRFRIKAIGIGGEALGEPSDPFGRAAVQAPRPPTAAAFK